jgi:hypothetical protein
VAGGLIALSNHAVLPFPGTGLTPHAPRTRHRAREVQSPPGLRARRELLEQHGVLRTGVRDLHSHPLRLTQDQQREGGIRPPPVKRQALDAQSGTYDMGFRDHDAGRAGPYAGNRYAFTGGNPTSGIDFDGHGWLDDVAGWTSPAAPARI